MKYAIRHLLAELAGSTAAVRPPPPVPLYRCRSCKGLCHSIQPPARCLFCRTPDPREVRTPKSEQDKSGAPSSNVIIFPARRATAR